MSNNRKICLGDIELTQSSEVEALNSRVSTIEGIIPIGKTINTTWASLKSLRDNSQLVPGQFYRITDYVTTTTQTNTQSAGHQFDVIVRADEINKLNENAFAALHGGDTYFANNNLAAWKLKYTIDNDTNRFAWADSTNGKGVIYRMIDEFNNDVPYDFKNVQYVKKMGFTAYNYYSSYTTTYERYEANDTTVSGTLYYGFKRVSYIPGPPSMDEYVWTKTTALTTSMPLYKISSGNVSSVTGTITKVNTSSFTTFTFDKNGNDVSISGGSESVTENSIASYIKDNKQTLNVIYFRTISEKLSAYGNSFNANCYNMSFGYSCYGNTFGTNNYSNSFRNYCSYNSFGNYCESNSFGDRSSYNSFGNYCESNSFSNNCESNYFNNNCRNNSLGPGCESNYFNNNCSNNSLGVTCESNYFNNNCSNNSLGRSCSNNAFGNYCQYNTLSKDYSQYNIVENGNQYITLTSTQTTSSSNPLRNIKICQGVNNTTTRKTISHDTVNDTFQTEYKAANSQIITV